MNKKGFKVIALSGFAGLMLIFFFSIALIVTGVIIPVYLIKAVWNYVVAFYFPGPAINFPLAFLLWLAAALTLFVIFKNFVSLSFQKCEMDSEEEFEQIIQDLSKNQDEYNNSDKSFDDTKK